MTYRVVAQPEIECASLAGRTSMGVDYRLVVIDRTNESHLRSSKGRKAQRSSTNPLLRVASANLKASKTNN